MDNIYMGLKLMGVGLLGVFIVLTLFYIMIKVLMWFGKKSNASKADETNA
ncbi:MAG: hypothetical protein GX800_09075 [Clostridiaceae bacterium]|jgi:hypothetical protein|nr:hypothetical protein [Clostridiaceae bacterium]